MGCVYSQSFEMSAKHREANQRIEWRPSVPEELHSKKSGEEPSTLPSSANPGSRKIAPEEPEKNLTIVREEIVSRSSCVSQVEVINAWELWDGLEEEEEHHQEFSEEHSINSQTKDDDEEKVDYKFAVISKPLEVGKDESQAIATPLIDESLTRNNSLEKYGEVKPVIDGDSNVSMEESDKADKHEDEAGPEQVAPSKKVGEVKAPSMEITKNMSLREWLRQGSKTKHPRFSVAQSFGSFAFPEIGFGDERDEELVFDPEMLLQFEQAMDQLNTDEEFLIEEVMEKLVRDQEKEAIKSME